MKHRNITSIQALCLMCIFSILALGAGNIPLHHSYLQDPLDGNGQSITNLNSVVATNGVFQNVSATNLSPLATTPPTNSPSPGDVLLSDGTNTFWGAADSASFPYTASNSTTLFSDSLNADMLVVDANGNLYLQGNNGSGYVDQLGFSSTGYLALNGNLSNTASGLVQLDPSANLNLANQLYAGGHLVIDSDASLHYVNGNPLTDASSNLYASSIFPTSGNQWASPDSRIIYDQYSEQAVSTVSDTWNTDNLTTLISDPDYGYVAVNGAFFSRNTIHVQPFGGADAITLSVDGSGDVASGLMSWDVSGNLTAASFSGDGTSISNVLHSSDIGSTAQAHSSQLDAAASYGLYSQDANGNLVLKSQVALDIGGQGSYSWNINCSPVMFANPVDDGSAGAVGFGDGTAAPYGAPYLNDGAGGTFFLYGGVGYYNGNAVNTAGGLMTVGGGYDISSISWGSNQGSLFTSSGGVLDLATTPDQSGSIVTYDGLIGDINAVGDGINVSLFSNDAGYIPSSAIGSSVQAYSSSLGYLSEISVYASPGAYLDFEGYMTLLGSTIDLQNGGGLYDRSGCGAWYLPQGSGNLAAAPAAGTFTMTAGSATVSDTNVDSSSVITASPQPGGIVGTLAPFVITPTAGVGFTVSGGALDNSTYNYQINQ
jgi:hypothetical protein